MKGVKIIGCNGSPRKNGNTYTIRNEMLQGATQGGARVEYIHLPLLHIEGCVG